MAFCNFIHIQHKHICDDIPPCQYNWTKNTWKLLDAIALNDGNAKGDLLSPVDTIMFCVLCCRRSDESTDAARMHRVIMHPSLGILFYSIFRIMLNKPLAHWHMPTHARAPVTYIRNSYLIKVQKTTTRLAPSQTAINRQSSTCAAQKTSAKPNWAKSQKRSNNARETNDNKLMTCTQMASCCCSSHFLTQSMQRNGSK